MNKSKSFYRDYVYDRSLNFPVNDIIGSFSSGSMMKFHKTTANTDSLFDYNGNNIFLNFTDRTQYKLIANNNHNYDTTSLNLIEIDGQLYRSLRMTEGKDVFEIFEFFSIQEVDNVIEKNIDFDWIKKTYEEYKEILDDEKSLVQSGGEGYQGLFKEEIFEIFYKVTQCFDDEFLNVLNYNIDQSFFNYESSLIEDLSRINNVSYYQWNAYYSNLMLFSQIDKLKLIEWAKIRSQKDEKSLHFELISDALSTVFITDK